MVNIQTLYDVLYALAVVVGISVAITLAMVVAGELSWRGKVSAPKVGSPRAVAVQQPTRTDARDLALR